MSQQRRSMKWIEEGSGLTDKLLRPLCAHNMDPILVEREGKIDRTKLLSITGLSRTPQYAIANKHNITEFKRPGGGCLLTDKNFAVRMKDTLDHGYKNFRETIALKWGRHFRIKNSFKVILGRDEQENLSLMRYAHKEDIMMHDKGEFGPVLILKGENPPKDVLKVCAGLIQRYSKFKNDPSIDAYYYKVSDKNNTFEIQSTPLQEEEIDKIRIEYAYDPQNPQPFKKS